MDRYQKVEKPRPESVIKENEIRITSQGVVRNYVSYATSLLQVWIPLSRWLLSFFGVSSPISHGCRFYFLTLLEISGLLAVSFLLICRIGRFFLRCFLKGCRLEIPKFLICIEESWNLENHLIMPDDFVVHILRLRTWWVFFNLVTTGGDRSTCTQLTLFKRKCICNLWWSCCQRVLLYMILLVYGLCSFTFKTYLCVPWVDHTDRLSKSVIVSFRSMK